MLILVLIDCQYIQNVVFSFEKDSYFRMVKILPRQIPTNHEDCFGLVRVVSSSFRVGSVAADSFGWVVTDGFGWLLMISVGFGWFRMISGGLLF